MNGIRTAPVRAKTSPTALMLAQRLQSHRTALIHALIRGHTHGIGITIAAAVAAAPPATATIVTAITGTAIGTAVRVSPNPAPPSMT
jgi:hypothetical protein